MVMVDLAVEMLVEICLLELVLLDKDLTADFLGIQVELMAVEAVVELAQLEVMLLLDLEELVETD